MAIAFVKEVGSVDGNANTTLVYTIPTAGVAAGNTLLIGVVYEGDSTTFLSSVVDSKSNSYTIDRQRDTGSGGTLSIAVVRGYMTTALVNGDTVTLNTPGFSNLGGAFCEFSGLGSSSVFDTDNGQYTGYGTSHTSGNITTAEANELLFGVHAYSSDGTSWAAGGSSTLIADRNYPTPVRRMATQYRIVSSTGTYDSAGTTATSARTMAEVASYKEPAVPPVATTFLLVGING